MAELKDNEIDRIKQSIKERLFEEDNVVQRKLLEDILSREFPNATIAIIRGYDHFSDEAYTHDAYFSELDARTSMTQIKPNGDKDLKNTYHLIIVNPRMLLLNQVIDKKTEKELEDIDKIIIYAKLA